MIQSIQHPSRIQDVRFSRHPLASDTDSGVDANELLFVAGEDKKITVYASSNSHPASSENDDDETGEPVSNYSVVAELVGHTNRYVHLALPHG